MLFLMKILFQILKRYIQSERQTSKRSLNQYLSPIPIRWDITCMYISILYFQYSVFDSTELYIRQSYQENR